MKQIHFSRKRRQLKAMAERYQYFLTHQTEDNSFQVEKLVLKIKNLLKELTRVFSRTDLKKMLGAAAVFTSIALANPVSAQSFGPPQANPFGLTPTLDLAFPAFADLDGDGDMDLLVGEYYGGMQYFENTGSATNPQFAAPLMNPFGIVSVEGLAFPAFADIDGDGDMDLLVGEYYGAMQYFQNTGSASNPQFAAPQTNPFGLVATYYYAFPEFADLDGDGDMDLLVGEYGEYGGSMQYFQNTGSASNPQFAVPQMNPFGLTSTNSYLAIPDFTDLDEDGDLDLLVGEYGGAMQYYQNTGSASNPQFAAAQENPFGLVSVNEWALPKFVDLDGDGDQDLLVGEYYGAMNYFENISLVGIRQLSKGSDFLLFPNPAKDVIRIKTEDRFSRIEIFDAAGKSVVVSDGSLLTFNIANLNKGTYLIRLTDLKGNLETKSFQKQ